MTDSRDSAANAYALTLTAYHALSLARLRDSTALASTLRRVEASRPSWPFALHWSSAILLTRQNKQKQAVDQLVHLFDHFSRHLCSQPSSDTGIESTGLSPAHCPICPSCRSMCQFAPMCLGCYYCVHISLTLTLQGRLGHRLVRLVDFDC